MKAEELKYRKKCLYCGDNFLAYRNTGKFDTPGCRKKYSLENYPNCITGRKLTLEKQNIKRRLKNRLKIEGDLRSDELRELVRDKVLSIVESIDAEKISKANLQTASKAAANLSGVFKNFTREENPSDRRTQQFVFYGIAPKLEDEYEILEAEVINR